MKYDHAVKYNGKFYKAGEDVPVRAVKKPKAANDKSPDKKPTDEG